MKKNLFLLKKKLFAQKIKRFFQWFYINSFFQELQRIKWGNKKSLSKIFLILMIFFVIIALFLFAWEKIVIIILNILKVLA